MTSETADNHVFELISQGFDFEEVRDDIYEGVISIFEKLKTNKDKEKCYKRGIDVLSKCACFFIPAESSLNYICQKVEEIYFSELTYREDYLKGAYVINALKKNFGIYFSESRSISKDMLKSISEIIKNSSCFDSSLNKIMEMQAIKFTTYSIPWVLVELCNSILANKGRTTEGIFRLSGDASQIDQLRKNMLVFNIPPPKTDANISASLLKSWFRDITDPMIPLDMYDKCIESVKNPQKPCEIVLGLSKLSREIIFYITRFIRLFLLPEYVEITLMGYSNMALVWSPNLLRCPYSNPMQVSKYSAAQNMFVQIIFQSLNLPADSSDKFCLK